MIMLLQDGVCTVFIEDEDEHVDIHCEHLEPVIPSLNDQVKVLYGIELGSVGVLINIDGHEGLVNFGEEWIELIQLRYLCRYQSN